MFRVEKCGEVLYNGRYNHMVKGYDRFMKRILIVEDDKGLNDGLVYDLREEGYEVSSALTAMRAMETFRLQEPDLVLMDVNLPDSDGFALCSQMKRLRDVPVIFLTARDLEQDEMRGFDCGADDFNAGEESYEITTSVAAFSQVRESLEKQGYSFLSAEVSKIPSNTVDLNDVEIEKFTRMLDMFDDNDDVQDVYHNANLPETEDEE